MDYESLGKEFRQAYGGKSHFGSCDFRPKFDGFWVNLALEIARRETRDATLAHAWMQFWSMVGWTAANRSRFGRGDYLQVIVGWTTDVRTTGRETLKGGIEVARLKELPQVLDSRAFEELGGCVVQLPGWDTGVFV